MAAVDEARARLIIRGLSGQHLHGFLPGNDNRGAIARAAGGARCWGGPGQGWGGVTRDGIGEWPRSAGLRDRRPSVAVLFVRWAEVLEVIARGCEGGRRRRYETAWNAWNAGLARAWKDHKPGVHPSPATPDPSIMRLAEIALIRHGCEQPEVQGALF